MMRQNAWNTSTSYRTSKEIFDVFKLDTVGCYIGNGLGTGIRETYKEVC